MWKNGTGDSVPDAGAPPIIDAATFSTSHGDGAPTRAGFVESANVRKYKAITPGETYLWTSQ